MNQWLKAMNPKGSIEGEAEAVRAARASAISIFIGVVVGLIGLAWTLANPGAMQEAVAQAGGDPAVAAAASTAAQVALWMGVGMIVIQLIFGIVQWRDPKKFIAVLFIVLIILGMLSVLAAPMMAGLAPGAPETPMWQLVLSMVVMVVQLILHVGGLRGIARLDQIQMAAAR